MSGATHDPRTGNESSTGFRALLTRPAVYELWSDLVGARRSRAEIVRTYVRPASGNRILDLGCGPGELLSFLPSDVRYTGVDISPQYIDDARRRFGDRAEFLVGDASAFAAEGRRFELVVVFGVLHHLSDDQVRGLLSTASTVLEPGGRFMSVDPTLTDGQSPIARAIIRRDRGQHVRSPQQYVALVRTAFDVVRPTVRDDLLRMPYTHCVLECADGRVGATSVDE